MSSNPAPHPQVMQVDPVVEPPPQGQISNTKWFDTLQGRSKRQQPGDQVPKQTWYAELQKEGYGQNLNPLPGLSSLNPLPASGPSNLNPLPGPSNFGSEDVAMRSPRQSSERYRVPAPGNQLIPDDDNDNDGDTEDNDEDIEVGDGDHNEQEESYRRGDEQEESYRDDELENQNPHGGDSEFSTDEDLPKVDYPTPQELGEYLLRFQNSVLATVDKSIDKMVTALTAHLPPAPAPVAPATVSEGLSRLVKPAKITGFPVRRSREIRDRQRLVREHMARLVGDNISLAVVSDTEIKVFEVRWKEDKSADCCTADSFRINLQGGPKTPWNISAARVFARSYVDHHKLDVAPKTLIAISNCATTRIKSLRYKFSNLMRLSTTERLDFEKAARRRGRKATLFFRRLEVCSLHPKLVKHRPVIQRLGIDGMSSDESDYGELGRNPPARTRPPRYYVLQPSWRHKDLCSWLETFDVVYCIIRRLGFRRRGAYARQRQQNATRVRYSTSKSFVPGLSVSAYCDTWLAGRGDLEFVVFPSPERYSFTHDPEVIRYIQSTMMATLVEDE